jgi:hypothetical protein
VISDVTGKDPRSRSHSWDQEDHSSEPTCRRQNAARRSCPGCRLRHRSAAPACPGRDRARRPACAGWATSTVENCAAERRASGDTRPKIVSRRSLESALDPAIIYTCPQTMTHQWPRNDVEHAGQQEGAAAGDGDQVFLETGGWRGGCGLSNGRSISSSRHRSDARSAKTAVQDAEGRSGDPTGFHQLGSWNETHMFIALLAYLLYVTLDQRMRRDGREPIASHAGKLRHGADSPCGSCV